MSKQYDVTAIGELLIDFTDNGRSEQGNTMFEANPGGAPCNVLAMLAKLGKKTSFIGKVGNDTFGRQLKSVIEELGIESKYLYLDSDYNTTLVLVHTFADGDRDFSFYRNPGADMMLSEKEVPEEVLADTEIFHFCTISMSKEPVRSATKKALEYARKHKALISFDPNIREPLWTSLEEAREEVLYGLSYCDILKISDNEIVWLTGTENYSDGVEWIKERFPDIKLVLVSLGKEGSRAYYRDFMVEVPAVISPETIETTGAGDTFGACVLYDICQRGLENRTEEDLVKMLRFANAAAFLVTTKKGALRVMPDRESIERIVGKYYDK